MKEESWHRRHAVQIASALPDDPGDALIVLRLATQIVTDFLAEPEPIKKGRRLSFWSGAAKAPDPALDPPALPAVRALAASSGCRAYRARRFTPAGFL
jgi:hypothetical protein